MPRATKAQKQQRIRIIYEMLLVDTSRSDIVQFGAKNWGVASRQMDKYIAESNNIIAQEAGRIQQEAFEQHLVKRANLRFKALEEGDRRLAFDILKDEAKLLDLYPDDRIKHTWQTQLPEGYEADEVQKQFAQLIAQAALNSNDDTPND